MSLFGRVDLHTHTTCSDGRLAPARLVEKAHAVGLSGLAVTDHDSVDAWEEALAAGRRLGIELVPGVELGVTVGEEEVHVLGFCFDPHHRVLKGFLAELREERRARAAQMVERLNELNIPLAFEDVLARAGTGTIGRPHIAQALVEEDHVSAYRDAFTLYLGNRAPAYVPRRPCEPETVIRLLREAGGISVLAHPGHFVTDRALMRLIRAGIDGIETVHPSHDSWLTRYYRDVARDFFLIETGGSDYHGHRENEEENFGRFTVPSDQLKRLRVRPAA